jgi:hypothetical protein
VLTRAIRYYGSPARVGMLAQMLREEGVQVEYEPPQEERGLGADIAAGVIVYILTKGGEEAIQVAVRRFRERTPRNQVTIEGDDNEGGDDKRQVSQ